MPVFQNGFGQNIKILRRWQRVPKMGMKPPAVVRILPTCSHTDAQARPPKSLENATFSCGSMTDRQTGSCLAESSGRACKGENAKLRSQNFFTSARTCEGWVRIPETSMWFCLYRPHARGMGHVDDEDKNTVAIRDGIAHTREGMGILVTDFSLTKYRPHARGRGMGKNAKLRSSKYRP